MAARCSVCGSTTGPFSSVEGVFAVLMYVDCLATRGHGTGPYPAMTRAEMRVGLDLLPTWVLETKAAANRRVIAVMRQRLAAGEDVSGAGAGVAGAASRGRRGPGHRAAGIRRPQQRMTRSSDRMHAMQFRPPPPPQVREPEPIRRGEPL